MTRAEHLQWCKDRALEYARRGDVKNAVASMCSDLTKHPETANHSGGALGVMLLVNGHMQNQQKVVEWIEGFN
jgi:hypothetical protein